MFKKEKKDRDDLTNVMRFGLIMFFITAVVLIVCVGVGIYLNDIKNERNGYAVISMDVYIKTIYFTEVDMNHDIYTFYLVDGTEVQCHRDNVVIYYDEDKE